MGDTSLKFGGWGLCATCGKESQVKATENKKYRKKKNPAKTGVEKKQKKTVEMVHGGSTV